jgi:hypothetical protein
VFQSPIAAPGVLDDRSKIISVLAPAQRRFRPGRYISLDQRGHIMTLSEATRNKAILAVLILAGVAAAIAGAAFGSGIFQAILFSIFALSAVILSAFLIVALN